MNIKRIKFFIHFWISLTSTFAFLGGWALFSHSAKPAAILPNLDSNTQVQSSANLAPIPSLDTLLASTSSTKTNAIQLPSLQLSAQSSTPMLRTRGS